MDGTPGTWKQGRPAAVTTDPSPGTIPAGYWVWNVTSGHLKRHAGGYVWEVPGASDAELKLTRTCLSHSVFKTKPLTK